MVSQGLFTDAEHEREAELEAVRLQKVALSANDETTGRDEHTSWGRF